ncbi:MAG: phosphoribosylaminoimidazolesuccinocarboxamide synthase [Alphaproteobacteria bacterium]|nr:phosphoribosylaminoimidazolesuccinocarboxamide synthase [Alphaproteobacteria bacterium]
MITSDPRQKIYEGKAKILYSGPTPGTLIQYFKDSLTAFNNVKKAERVGKGILTASISEQLMTLIGASAGLPTCFIKRLSGREQLIREADIIPIEVMVRNYAAGSLVKRLGLTNGTRLNRSIVEYAYKNDELGDPLIGEEHITAMGLASPQELDDIMAMALRINDLLCGYFYAINITLVDFKLEFGRVVDNEDEVRIILCDEISPDTCRLWDRKTDQKLDKDLFRQDLGDVMAGYQEVAKRMGVIFELSPEEK